MYFLEGRQKDRPTDRQTDLGIKAPSRTLKNNNNKNYKNLKTIWFHIRFAIKLIRKFHVRCTTLAGHAKISSALLLQSDHPLI